MGAIIVFFLIMIAAGFILGFIFKALLILLAVCAVFGIFAAIIKGTSAIIDGIKNRRWNKRLAEEQSKPEKVFRCPFCSKQIEKNAHSCESCYARFHMKSVDMKLEDREMKLVNVWLSGEPEILYEIRDIYSDKIREIYSDNYKSFLTRYQKDRVDFEPIAKKFIAITEHNVHYYGIYEAIKDFEISCSNFSWNVQYTFGELVECIYFAYLEKVLLDASGNIENVRNTINCYDDLVEFLEQLKGSISQFRIDIATGGGYFSKYSYWVQIDPPQYPMAPDTPSQPMMSYILWAWRNQKQKEFEYKHTNEKLCCFNIVTPENQRLSLSQMEQFWSSLQSISYPVVFEIVGSGYEQVIAYQFLCNKVDKGLIAGQLRAIFPDINIEGNDHDYFLNNQAKHIACDGRSFVLSGHYSYPIRTSFTSFETADPLTGLMEPLSQCEDGEMALIQAIIAPSKNGWDKGLKTLANRSSTNKKREENPGYAAFQHCPCLDKIKRPLFAVSLHAAMMKEISEDDESEFPEKVSKFPRKVKDVLSIFDLPEGNQLKIADDEICKMYKTDVIGLEFRTTRQHGFLLNTQELAALCHFPSKSLQHPKLLGEEKGLVPMEFQEGELLIGVQESRREELPAYIPAEWRPNHTYIVGYTGMGKTTLMTNMIKQDIDAGRGVGVIDIKGTGRFIQERILPLIPEHRIEDVVLFDMTDTQYPIGFNLLALSDKSRKDQRKQQLRVILERATEGTMPDQMATLFSMCLDALINAEEPYTLSDVETLIYNDAFRHKVVSQITEPYYRRYWDDVFGVITTASKSGIQRRMADILGDTSSRIVLTQPQMALDFQEIISEKKIFLARIPRGNFPITASFFARTLMAMIQMAVFSRQGEVVPFHLYVDEFQHFADETFEEVIDEAREAGLYLTLSHQRTNQLSDDMLSACMSVGTRVVFQVQPPDARRLSPFFSDYSEDDILKLGKFNTITSIGSIENNFKMKTYPDPTTEQDHTQQIIDYCRNKYCMKLEQTGEHQLEKKDEEEPTIYE